MNDNGLSGLIGSNFKNMKGLSSFGRLYRISRLNSLTFGQAINLLGIDSAAQSRLRSRDFSVFKKGLILDRIRDRPRVGTWPTEDDLVPRRIIGSRVDAFLSNHALRGCLTCLKAGFHSLIHQARWIKTCPWHQDILVDHCICGRPLFEHPGDGKSFMMVCQCGYDFFDRLTSLKTLSVWPEKVIKRIISNEARLALDRRTVDDLHVESGLPLNIALAASFESDQLSPYWKRTEITYAGNGDFDSDEQIRKIIVCWDKISFPNYNISVPLLTTEMKQVSDFALTIRARFRQLKEHDWPCEYIMHHEEVRFGQASIKASDSVSSIYIADGNLGFARELILQFVSKYCIADAGRADWKFWLHNRDEALEHPNDKLKLLARILSVLASHCLIEDLTKRAWASYAHKTDYFSSPFPVRCSGKAMLLRRRGEFSKASLFRMVPLPEFKDPTPEHRLHFLRSQCRVVTLNSPFFSTDFGWSNSMFMCGH